MNGDNLKLKVRIRWYGGQLGATGPTRSRSSSRSSTGSDRRGGKHRRMVSVPARWISEVPLSDPSLPAFLYRQAGLFDEAFRLHLVAVHLHFLRAAALSVSRGPAAAWRSTGTSGPSASTRALLPCRGGVRLDRALCEFKSHGGAPPPWGLALYRAGFRLRSFSKYGECMNQVLNGGAPHE